MNTEIADKKIVNEDSGAINDDRLTFSQVFEIWKQFVTDNKTRNGKNAAIARKINGEQPWSSRKLKAAGQSWRSNRPTGFMNSLLKRLMAPYKQLIDQMPFLTYARFAHETIGTENEQDIFRSAVTDCIRQWSGWADFVSQLVDECIVYGYCAVGWNDKYSWEPKVLRSDVSLFYVGCPQTAAKVKCWGYSEDFYIDEIANKLKSPEDARAAGWHVRNLIKKLNNAESQFSDRNAEENERQRENLLRENSLSASFTSPVRVVKAAHFFSTNHSGGVDHYIFDREDGTALFYSRSAYSSMDRCVSLFTAETGDATLHGSRGAGRALYNTHVSVEQARNLIQDALHLNGLLLLRANTRLGTGQSETPAMTVMHPFAIIGEGHEIVEKVKFEINSEAFFELDRYATAQAEVLVGAFMPGQLSDQSGGRRTASEVNYVAGIDAQIRSGVLARFADQFFLLVEQLQRRICSPDVIKFCQERLVGNNNHKERVTIFDPETWRLLQDFSTPEELSKYLFIDVPDFLDRAAVECVSNMIKKGLPLSKISLLAEASSRSSVEDTIASQSGALDLLVSRYAADPMVDSVELKRRDIASKVGSGGAERLMKTTLNPLSAIKQQRQQILELAAMAEGSNVPVDPTDDDKIHLAVMADRIMSLLQGGQGQLPLANAKIFLSAIQEHSQAHIQSAQQKQLDLRDIADVLEVFKQLDKLLLGKQTSLQEQAASVVDGVTSQGAVPAVAPPEDALTAAPSFNDTLENAAVPGQPTPPTNPMEVARKALV